MSIGKLKKSGLVVVSVIVTIALGYILGIEAAGYFARVDAEKAREIRTQKILEKMGSGLAIGKKMDDALFFDLEDNQVQLSQLLCEKTLIVYFKPECSFSAAELRQIARDLPDSVDQACIVLISEAFPDELRDVRAEYNLKCPILHDPDGSYAKHLGISSVPINFFVDDSFVIQNIVPSVPHPHEIEEVVMANRKI